MLAEVYVAESADTVIHIAEILGSNDTSDKNFNE